MISILVIGLGFVGLTTALGFADKGFCVYGYDINKSHADRISNGEVPFYEAGLPEALKRNLRVNFFVTEDLSELKVNPDVVFLSVGTPCDDSGRANLEYLEAAIDSIASCVGSDSLLVVKSTVPPGTTKSEILPCIRSKGINCPVAVNPEFLREGYCWSDFTEPDRVVCGVEGSDEQGRAILNTIYAPFNAPIHFVSPNTAEFIKYLSNTMLACMISYSNEMATVADAVGEVSVGEAFKILHEDKRLAGSGITHYIYPGCGYGGYCLPKDTVALIENSKRYGFTPNILQEVVRLNNDMPRFFANKIMRAIKSKSEKIGILGLSFKPNSDDVRDSSAAKIIKILIEQGYNSIFAYDPIANKKFEDAYAYPITYCTSKEEVCKDASAVALVTVWEQFKGINNKYPDVEWIDCRYSLEKINNKGFLNE